MRWAEQWSQSRIDANRVQDRWAKDKYFSGVEAADLATPTQERAAPPVRRKTPGGRLAQWLHYMIRCRRAQKSGYTHHIHESRGEHPVFCSMFTVWFLSARTS